jgi:hypothetical protein
MCASYHSALPRGLIALHEAKRYLVRNFCSPTLLAILSPEEQIPGVNDLIAALTPEAPWGFDP